MNKVLLLYFRFKKVFLVSQGVLFQLHMHFSHASSKYSLGYMAIHIIGSERGDIEACS